MLTRAGVTLARRLRLALAELRQGLEEIAELMGEDSGRILVGAMPLSRARLLPLAIATGVAGPSAGRFMSTAPSTTGVKPRSGLVVAWFDRRRIARPLAISTTMMPPTPALLLSVM